MTARTFIFFWISLFFLSSALFVLAAEVETPQYTDKGALKLPPNTDEWIFVGSNLGLSYWENTNRDHASFHNIYISPDAFKTYRTTGVFPNGTMLILDRYEKAGKSPENDILTDGYFNGERTGFEIAVKDEKRPNRSNKSKARWAYYNFFKNGSLVPAAKPFADKTCQACHEKHAGEDHVWTQFYPVLRRAKAALKAQ